MPHSFSYRDISYAGLFGAAALLLPTVFHALHLGHVFMPMYLPLVTLAFFVRPLLAALTGLLVPLASGFATGMPPLYPPVGICMSMELAAMCGLLATLRTHWPRTRPILILAPVLAFGRFLYGALAYGAAQVLHLPAKFLAGLSLVAGWPGIVLMLVAVPAIVRIQREITTGQNTGARHDAS